MSPVETLKTVKQAIRAGFAWPGGYQINLVMGDGELCCTDCGRKEFKNICRSTLNPVYDRDWQTVGAEVYWEGPDLACAHCGKAIPSEYGDPETA